MAGWVKLTDDDTVLWSYRFVDELHADIIARIAGQPKQHVHSNVDGNIQAFGGSFPMEGSK